MGTAVRLTHKCAAGRDSGLAAHGWCYLVAPFLAAAPFLVPSSGLIASNRLSANFRWELSRTARDELGAESGARAWGWARIINTTSGTGLFGAVGQANYGAAKAGIVSLTTITATGAGDRIRLS